MRTLLNKITNISFKVAKMILAITVAAAINNKAFAYSDVKEKSYYELQAELIYNFVDYVQWPQYFEGKEITNHKKLCVMEDNPIIPHLRQLISTNGKNLILVRKHENDYLEDCSILFVNDHYDGYLKKLLYRVSGEPILTFGNNKDFLTNGGVVQFTLRNNRVEFSIDLDNMKSAKINISESILSISNTIK